MTSSRSKAKRSFSNTTFLVGAGLSKDSGLPDGAGLAEKAFDSAVRTRRLFLRADELSHLRRKARRLRLEILLERLGEELSHTFLFKIFSSLKYASPNFNHFAVAATGPKAVVTTNQDLLIELAARRLGHRIGPIHLHGRCDNLASIVTTIGQYLKGLNPNLSNKFRRALIGADVVVLGYSGRDNDVIAVLAEAEMKSVTWLNHPGSSVAPEVHFLKETLGKRMRILTLDASCWLEDRFSTGVFRQLNEMAEESHINEKPTAARYTVPEPPWLKANLALGRILEHVNSDDVAIKLYRRLLSDIGNSDESFKSITRIELAIARVQMFQYRFGPAYQLHTRIARDIKAPLQDRCQALVDSATVLRNSSQTTRAQRALDELESLISAAPLTKTYRRFKGQALAARADLIRIGGHSRESLELYKSADRCFRQAQDVDGWIAASTWLADALIMLGRFREAAHYLKRAIDDSDAFGRFFRKAWPLYLEGELVGMAGDVNAGLRTIARALKVFEQVNNPQGQVYCLLHSAGFMRPQSTIGAQRALGRAQKLLHKRKFHHAMARFLIESAELARARGRPQEMRKYLNVLDKHLKDRKKFPISAPLLSAHSKAIEAEHARQDGNPKAESLLQQARDSYATIGAEHCTTRIEVALWLQSRAKADRSRLITICSKEGYGHELKQMRKPSTDYYPLHFS